MTKGAIAASDPQTAAAGASVLRRGGNAVDAAVAAAFASYVAEFSLVNIGGGGVATLLDGATGEAVTYDFFSDMPSGDLRDGADFRQIWIDFGVAKQPFFIGRASVAVPGVVAGLCAMADEHGTLPLPTLLQPAVELARRGVIISEQMAYAYGLLQPIFRDTPELAALFVPGGRAYRAGERIRFPQLADTLEDLGRVGPSHFYTGGVARAIVQDQQAHRGLLTAADLAAYRVRQASPIRVPYRDCAVLLPPPSSIGGVLVAFTLQLLSHVEVGQFPHNGTQHLRVLAEAMRLTNIARRSWKAAGAHAELALANDADAVHVERFLRRAHVQPYVEQLRAVLGGADAPPDAPTVSGPNDTTHISVADGAGRLVSITTSAGEGAGFLVGDTGISLNNMLGEQDLHPDGFHTLPPGTRMTTMMTPAIVMRHGQPVLAVGSGGSNRIRSAIVQALSNVIDFQMAPEEAVVAPRVHFEEGVLQLEGGIDPAVATELETCGYTVNRWPAPNMFFGGAHMVSMQGGELTPAGDPRRGGSVEHIEG